MEGIMIEMNYCPVCQSELSRETSAEGPVRLVCSGVACQYVFWNNPTPVVAAIIEVEGQVMLVHHVGWPEKMLGLVTGFLEAVEHPDEAVRREIKEETQLDVDALSFIGHYAFVEQNQLILAYHARCSGRIVLNEELDRFKMLSPEKLKPWALGTGPAVRDWLAQR
jgi:NADH pyrophosphatase NudC (nudix superfamily)